jgi:hypothetical protein
MNQSSLQAFAAQVARSGRISAEDVKTLQRRLLPDGVASREEAECLLALDRAARRADPRFADWLVAVLVDFVVWGARPTGCVDREIAGWLAPWLTREPTRTARRLAQEIAREAHGLDAVLLAGMVEAASRPVGQDGALPLAA